MKLLILVLNKVEALEDILENFSKSGIKGATIIDSQGMARVLTGADSENLPLFGSLSMLINENRPFNKTIFSVLNEEDIPLALSAIEDAVGDITKPDVGIVFTIPIDFVKGIQR
ncbi:hypothetical protein [Clostridium polynesiense]|uniref:hypothetical protein n=1 Tax=Clostridium polynesiense TaxID=1325933 RepID=UPI000590B3C0|nr:hypothetical protein [Clostridium polynesiense]